MGEIKSTLDLIMEKTKNLTMSSEEKKEIRRQEWLKKARGWIQKFLDDLADTRRVKTELLEKEPISGWEKILKKELVEGLDPEGNNEKRFELIKILLALPSEPYREVLASFTQQVEQQKDYFADALKEQLSVQGISGSAVVPNLEPDPSWKHFYEQEIQACRDEIAGL